VHRCFQGSSFAKEKLENQLRKSSSTPWTR